ncbi:Golgi membrane protein 1 isoform X2 [Trichomycterus rosablanca]|uniref:Golgi membrane protein 1 isoform X2 n=1 Tax=Trichomycterus rosablanca TaxID=2290929 RepID=UPI002F3522C7
MMAALVNGRRGGRSPPLLMAGLIGCILLLGFNYWVSSSRNLELQTKLLELEDRVRRASAEREREQLSRSEAEEQVRRQSEQLTLMENTHQKQQQSAEKGNLLLNISSSGKTVQEMKNQMKNLLEDLSRVQKELQSCQNNMNTLNKKLTYDTTQCNTQILAQKEDCNEKIAAAKLEVEKKYEKLSSEAQNQASVSATQKAVSKPASEIAGNESNKITGALETKMTPGNLETNEIPQIKAVTVTVKDSNKDELPTTPSPPNQNETLSNLTNDEAMAGVMDIKGEDLKTADALLDAAVNEEVKEDAAIEYDNEREIEKRLSNLKGDKAAAQEFDDELADYNGDDENEPEFEADKQAELAEA